MEISPDKPTEIEISSASVLYGKERVLENISLSIREKRVGFIGRNGSGKTTLLRILAGLQELKNGKVLIDGTEVAKERKAAIKKVVIIFQNPDHQIIFPTVGEELRFGLTQLGLKRNDADLKVIACLKKYDKIDWFERSISTLSQGQKHLVCLLSVLLMKPRVLLLDEPFTGIDVKTEDQIINLLNEFRKEGKVMLISTHNLGSVPEFCDRSILIKGTILKYGLTENVFTRENLENAFGGVLRHFSLGGRDLHEDGDKREVSILTDDERPFVQYGNVPLKKDKK